RGLDVRADEPRPDRALVIRPVPISRPAAVARDVRRVARREAAQPERRQKLRAALDDRTLVERRVRKRDREQLIRAQRRVADDVGAAPVDEARSAEAVPRAALE